MNAFREIEKFIGEKILTTVPLGGGCINDTYQITTSTNKSFFLKTNKNAPADMFSMEAKGLEEIQSFKVLSTPKVLLVNAHFLLLEFIEVQKKTPTFFQTFGKLLAQHHQIAGTCWGYWADNYIGANRQVNPLTAYQLENSAKDWAHFYFENRILYQLKLAEENGLSDTTLSHLISKLESKIPEILAPSVEPPALLHGDLWGGNFLINNHHIPVMIDPAVYYGHREVDLAMTKLFGGFSNDFYKAYSETYPLKPGYEYRENLYHLYHVLNHLNLFGKSYYGQCILLIQSYF